MSPAEFPHPGDGRPTRAEIDLDAFEHNLRTATGLGGKDREVMAVVKADAYGHGAVPAARRALEAGASCLGVATVPEARQLRDAGIGAQIVILSEVSPSAAGEVVRRGCAQVVYTPELIDALEAAGREAGRPVRVHLKVDTGMGRVGARPEDAPDLVTRIGRSSHLEFEGLLSHLADADDLEKESCGRQLGEFNGLCQWLEVKGLMPRYRHIANSALIMRGETTGNLTRPGIMLYGSPPAPGFPGSETLRPVMRFVTALVFLKKVPAGRPLSYGGTFVTSRESLIATIPAGYADGYARGLSNRATVLVRGKRAPQVGTVCMDMCLVDVTDIPGAAVGDEAVLLGRQGEEEIKADETAALLGTISYEIYCSVSRRVPRVYRGLRSATGRSD